MNDPYMAPRNDFLAHEQEAALVAPQELEVGTCHDYKLGPQEIRLLRDAEPLAGLVRDAELNLRVYELMSIRRPGDVLAYLRLMLPAGQDFLAERLTEAARSPVAAGSVLSLAALDRLLGNRGEEADFLQETWDGCRSGLLWEQWPQELLAVVREVQARVRGSADLLIRLELELMETLQHRCDYFAQIARYAQRAQLSEPGMPPAVVRAVLALVVNLGLPAVAADESGIDFWRALCHLQMQRARDTGKPPGEALALFASDRGKPLRQGSWGGDVFVSWEGMCIATLVVLPHWRVFNVARACEVGTLYAGLMHWPRPDDPMVTCGNGYQCHRDECLVMVSREDFGELTGTECLRVDGWSIYVSRVLLDDPARLAALAGLD